MDHKHFTLKAQCRNESHHRSRRWIIAVVGIVLAMGCQPLATPLSVSESPTVSQDAGRTLTTEPTTTSSPVPSPTPTAQPYVTQPFTATHLPPPVRIMPLGDSLTEGDYPGCISSYRGHLRHMLLENGYGNIDFVGEKTCTAHGDLSPPDRDHSGHSNYTIGPDIRRLCPSCETTGLYEHVAEWLATSEPDFILLLIGINDLLNSAWHVPGYATTAPERMESLATRIIELRPSSHLLLASLLPVRWTEGSNWKEYQALNSKIREIAERDTSDNIHFVDLNAVDLDRSENGDFCDLAHPNRIGAQKIARAWYDALVPLLFDYER